MSNVGQPERSTQERVVAFFRDQLGYEYLGDRHYREDNTNVEPRLLGHSLEERGYSAAQITKAVERLQREASLGGGRKLYEANRDVYSLLRYGIPVKTDIEEKTETVWPIDWENPEENRFAIAEEVTVEGENDKRPDIVLYVNGIAVVTIELKRSRVSVSDGIRQSYGNQKHEFIQAFFTTVQLVIAGNDVEGLRYSPIDTEEKYWLTWREPGEIDERLDGELAQLCSKERLLELIHDFMAFDAGVKKTCRHNQYFAVKAAQERVASREGGIVWHTQGSGKSLIMVWLAKWIRESQDQARVLIVTDRTELDEQIEKVFSAVGEGIHRTRSAADMLDVLSHSTEWLICSLLHKFRDSEDEEDRDTSEREFIEELRRAVPDGFAPKGNLFVFVDEAHRTQSGRMHDAMKELLPGAMFVGFTGTPLLKADKETTVEQFGSFIHTYKFDEAVADGVVVDLRYEARNIDQRLSSPEKVDQWFEAKTKGMTDLSRARLKRRWGTMQKVVSAEPRAKQIVQDILLDMDTRPRLMDRRGNAMLVGSSIYQACKFYEMFCEGGLKGKCAVVTSYEPRATEISKEDSGHGATEKLRQFETYRQMLANHFQEPPEVAIHKVEEFEREVKRLFVQEPGQMRLLIVVDKLLTGFDAPSATYLYIDKKMRDHGLFQAICRVNRLDGEDKKYGYIVDYRDLFNSLESAIVDYTSGALDGYDRDDVEGLLKDRVASARGDLDEALERVRAICEPVAPPRDTLQYQQHFCAADPGDTNQLKQNEPKRVELYRSVAAMARAYANLANEMHEAGYGEDEAAAIKEEVSHFAAVRDEVELGAGENVDLKPYEAGMRFLLDAYIQADPSETVAEFPDKGLVQMIVEMGAAAIEELPEGVKSDSEAVAETIANNIRKVIVDERPNNPGYYDKMSRLLDALIEARRREAINYKAYLEGLIEQAEKVGRGEADDRYPEWADNGAKRALHDFGLPDDLGQSVDRAVMETKPDSWIGNAIKERKVRLAVVDALPPNFDRIDELMALVKARNEYR
ncbi:MAG TPA: type I restriction endonuclease subunit R [Solirubrobacterales bacterium]|jgi:type I restriction enzyme R subunit|nr:type I restriction endonuclease subunit R [Solirubrobacterales bacterium]